MEGYQQRVVDEKRSLDEKLEKLDEFIEASPIFQKLEFVDQTLMRNQADAMEAYSLALGARIKRFYGG